MKPLPERIPHAYWINSQLSIARHYGSCAINGVIYFVEPKTGDLVSGKLMAREAKARREALKAKRAKANADQLSMDLPI